MTGGGFRTFAAGEVLTNTNVNDFLMDQAVMNFAGTAARGSALPSPSAGMVAHIGGGSLTVYDGAAWSDVFPIGAATNNLLFNGAMQVAQRGTSVASITTSGYNTADRYRVEISSLGTWTQSVENDAPTGSGFRKSLRMLCTTADATPAAGDYMLIEQRLEGQDLQRIRKGTSSAVPLRLSFRVKGSTTGTYIVRLLDNDNTRHVSVAYTISVADTWETKVISIPADTTGAFDNDNAFSLGVQFWLGAGTTYTSGTLATTWASVTNANAAVGQTNLAGATNRYWQVTGVQLETGTVASPFQFKSFGQDLQECQRYYWRSTGVDAFTKHSTGYAWSTTNTSFVLVNPVNMRVTATAIESGNLGITIDSTSTEATTAVLLNSQCGPYASAVGATVASGLTAHRPYDLTNNNNTAGFIAFSAEL